MKPYVPRTLPLDDIDWEAHVKLIGQANAALARYDGMLGGIVNPGVLLSPLTTQEAVLSSRIEGTQASIGEVLEYEADPKEPLQPSKAADIQEIINYRRAMVYAVDSLKKRPVCLNLLKELHAILLDSARGRSKDPGNFRRIQNYIGPEGCTEENATFIPPSVDRMEPALDNWEKYVHFKEKDPLIQLAVVKAQFELIHPFLDGNGRIGRMLIPVFLYEKKVLSSPMFYMSTYFDKYRDLYLHRLQAISQEGDWNGWINFFLLAVSHQATINAVKTSNILVLYDRMKKEIPETTKSHYATSAIDALFNQPVFKSSDFIQNSGIPKESAMRIIKKLKEKGVLKELRPSRGRRGALLMFEELILIAERAD